LHRITLDLRERFPFIFRGRETSLQALNLYLKLKDEYVYDQPMLSFDIQGSATPSEAEPNFTSVLTQPPAQFGLGTDLSAGLPFTDPPLNQVPVPLVMALEIRENTVPMITTSDPNKDPVRLVPDAIDDIWLICHYTVA